MILKNPSAYGKAFATFLQTELGFFGNKFLKTYRHQIYTTKQMKQFDWFIIQMYIADMFAWL